MIIVELIGSISLVIALVSAVALTIIHIKNKQHALIIKDAKEETNQSTLALPFQPCNEDISGINTPFKFHNAKTLPIINVIDNDRIYSSSIKYGIQWTIPSNDDSQIETADSSSNIMKTSEFDQGDSLSLNDQTKSVRHLMEKFEDNSIQKSDQTENQIDSNLTSIDSQTVKHDFNQNQHTISHHSSISNLDVPIPSNLSSSIDLEQFECVSMTSTLSEVFNNN
ncbi:unnamed protein product [Rotaria socialis]|uniref:Uncharacterized protein n=1 Tax=Rotaria socialis TaxID=392032 RepID=A0A821CES1_9BILA|nr:unnamed protein product [Rotaria socialis]CAF3754049.1 unnamed protein product [Rotaria socialis]CAF4404145.1 unnamed protein product [Rotaria socialis]CAF4607400.1 unnamed protein product [Rotaria socialis]